MAELRYLDGQWDVNDIKDEIEKNFQRKLSDGTSLYGLLSSPYEIYAMLTACSIDTQPLVVDSVSNNMFMLMRDGYVGDELNLSSFLKKYKFQKVFNIPEQPDAPQDYVDAKPNGIFISYSQDTKPHTTRQLQLKGVVLSKPDILKMVVDKKMYDDWEKAWKEHHEATQPPNEVNCDPEQPKAKWFDEFKRKIHAFLKTA